MHFIAIGLGTITGGLLGGYLVDRHVSENWLLIPTLIFSRIGNYLRETKA